MKKILIVIFLIMCSAATYAQRTLHGTVTDSTNNTPLEMANVTLLRQGKPVKFTRTDAQGKFTLTAADGDRLSVTYLGYRKKVLPIPSGNSITIRLASEAFQLKEVTVKGAPVFGKADTTTYDLSRYATERDNTLSDVLKRLPGIDVAKNGQVSFMGDPISRLTVEGLDLTGGRYRKMTEALKAKDVDKAEVIEHDQPVKALQGKVYSDDVALNIKLKKEARDKWLPTLTPRVGIGDDLYLGGKAEVLQIGKQRQQLYEGELDRTGRQLTYNNYRLARSTYAAPAQEMSTPTWFSMPALSAPIDASRLRRNLSHNWGVNRIMKNENDRETRLTANYLHTTEWQITENEASYYFDEANPTTTRETRQMHLSRDVVDLAFYQHVNQPKTYGSEAFMAEIAHSNGISDFNESVRQQTERSELHLQNTFNRMFVRDRYQLSVYSDAELGYSPSRLTVNDERTDIKTWEAYTNNYLSWLRSKVFSTYTVRGGFAVDYLDAMNQNTRLKLYLRPSYEWKHGRTTLRTGIPMEWEYFSRQRQSFINLSPNANLNIKQSNRTEWSFYAQFSQQTDNWQEQSADSYRMDYRTYFTGSDFLPRTKSLGTGFSYSYKRPIKEFFWVWHANYNRIWNSGASDLQIIDGQYLYAYTKADTHADRYTFSTDISKGVFDWRLKTKLTFSYAYSTGQQASGGIFYGFTSHTLTASPSITWSPSWCDVSYEGTFTRNSTAQLSPLLDWRQSLSLTKTIKRVDIRLAGVHYHNEIAASPTLNTLIADASLVWRMKKLRLAIDLRNLLNKQTYRITHYSGITSATSTYHLRPREVVVSVQWSL